MTTYRGSLVLVQQAVLHQRLGEGTSGLAVLRARQHQVQALSPATPEGQGPVVAECVIRAWEARQGSPVHDRHSTQQPSPPASTAGTLSVAQACLTLLLSLAAEGAYEASHLRLALQVGCHRRCLLCQERRHVRCVLKVRLQVQRNLGGAADVQGSEGRGAIM